MDYSGVCGGKHGCSSQVTVACNCGNPVIFLCNSCAAHHFLIPRPHIFLTLCQARELIMDSEASGRNRELYVKNLKIQGSILTYIDTLNEFKARIFKYKQEVLDEIDAVVQSHIDRLDNAIESSHKIIDDMKERTADRGTVLMYESRGIKAIIGNCIEDLSFHQFEVRQAIQNMIKLIPYKESLSLVRSSDDLKPVSNSHILSLKSDLNHFKSQISYKLHKLEKDVEAINIISIEDIKTDLLQLKHQTIPAIQELNSKLKEVSPIDTQKAEESYYNFFSSDDGLKTGLTLLKSASNPLPELPHLLCPPSQSSIFVAKNGTKKLIKYDTELDSVTTYHLAPFLNNNFSLSSTCLLPNGTVIIAGGYSYPNSLGDTYKIDVSKEPPHCVKLANLHYPRYSSRLVCYLDTVYIIGGHNSGSINKAEKMKVTDSTWSLLPDMKEARHDFGVFTSDKKIYILGGYSNHTVEYYDIALNCFSMVPNAKVKAGGVVCAEIDDRIYIIGEKHLKVLNKKFEVVDGKKNINDTYPHCYSNVVVRGDKFIYVNSWNSRIYSFDIHNKNISELKEI